VRAGESVEVDAVFTGAGRSSRVYQGVATAFRRAR
jgi:hypothetical protein